MKNLQGGTHRRNKRRQTKTRKPIIGHWWNQTQERRTAKEFCRLVYMNEVFGESESALARGERMFSERNTQLVLARVCEVFPSIVAEYERDHEKPLTGQILARRVQNMYREWRPTYKRQAVSTEHAERNSAQARARIVAKETYEQTRRNQ